MASNRIKGITIQIGGDTTGLDKALKGVNKEVKDTQANLRDVERLLKLDPKNTELLAQKERLLNDAIEDTKNKLDTLAEVQNQLADEFNSDNKEVRRQYDALRREIIETEQSLESLQAAKKQVMEEKEKIEIEVAADLSGWNTKEAENSLDEITDAAEKTEDAVKDIGDAAAETGRKLGGLSGAAKNIAEKTKTISKVAGGIIGAAVATVPATKELRSDLSKLDAAAEENSVSVGKARDAWRLFAVQSGETDSAVEATANLLQAGFDDSNMQEVVEGLAGAVLRFPDTLKVESLADSLQETLATGSATGQFAELLDRVGIGAENFNTKLEKATTSAQKQQVALQALAEAGLGQTYNAWAKNNEEMLANEEASIRFQEATAEIAETVMPIVTKVIEAVTKVLDIFNSLDEGTQMIILGAIALVAAISPIASGIASITGAIGAIMPVAGPALTGITSIFSAISAFVVANPIVLIIAAIVALVVLIATKGEEIKAILQKVDDFLQGIFAKDWTEIFGPVLGGALNYLFDQVKTIWDGIKGVFDGIIDFIQAVFAGDWEAAWEAVKDIFGSIFDMIVGLAKQPLNAIISLVNAVIDGINALIGKLNDNAITEFIEGFGLEIPDIPEIPTIPMLAKGGSFRSGAAIVGEAGPELLSLTGGKATVMPLTNQTSMPQQAPAQTAPANNSPIEVKVYLGDRQIAHQLFDPLKAEAARRGGGLINV